MHPQMLSYGGEYGTFNNTRCIFHDQRHMSQNKIMFFVLSKKTIGRTKEMVF